MNTEKTAKWKKSVAKDHKWYDFIYTQNAQNGKSIENVDGCLGKRGGGEQVWVGSFFLGGGNKIF